jgi:hypothetical protein
MLRRTVGFSTVLGRPVSPRSPNRPAGAYTHGMADEHDDQAEERARIRDHYRVVLARVAAIDPDTREAELRVVRKVTAPPAARRGVRQPGDSRPIGLVPS